MRRFEASAIDGPGNPWENETVVLAADAIDRSAHPEGKPEKGEPLDPLDFYGWTVATSRINGTSQVYYAWAHRFWKCSADCNNNWDSVLLSSRDGEHFTYVGGSREPWLRPGRNGGRGSRMIHVMPGPIEVGNELWIYVAMTNQNHAGQVDPQSSTGGKQTAVGLIRMRRDGLASLDAPLFGAAAPANLTTVPVLLPPPPPAAAAGTADRGQPPPFLVNAVCSGGGVLRASLLDAGESELS